MTNDPNARKSCPSAHALGRFVDVGWILDTDHAKFMWQAPQRVRRPRIPHAHSKSLAHCPAVHDSDGRLFEITCPFDLHLGLVRDAEGMIRIKNLLGEQSSVRPKHLSELVKLVNPREWAHPERPVIQIVTPYVVVADEPVYVNQLPPFGFWKPEPLPGIMVTGRFPTDIWPRHLMWAFEWYATDRPLKLSRGEPWWYLRFDHYDPSRSIRMVPAEMTSELREYMAGIKGVTNYVSQTFELFKTAKARRPPILLVRKTGAAGEEAAEIDNVAQSTAAAEESLVELQVELYGLDADGLEQ